MTGRLAPDVARWIASIVLTALVALLTLLLGIFAGATGLAIVGLIVVAGLAAIAVRLWRGAILALSVIAFALAAGIAFGGGSTHIQPSFGTLAVTPQRPDEIDGASYRRGLGGIVVDLRETELPAGRTTHLRLRADSSRVVVALRRNTCVAVRLHVQPLRPNSALDELGDWTRSAGLGELGMHEGVTGPWFTPDLLSREHPDDLNRLTELGLLSRGFSGYVGPPGESVSQLFGLAPSRVYADADDAQRARSALFAPYSLERPTRVTNPAVLDLDISAGGPVIVRDYPAGRDVTSLDPSYGEALAWPFDQSLPPAPPTINPGAGWPARWDGSSGSRSLRARWAVWERETVREAQRLARLQAGSCASPESLRNQWQAVRYGGETGAVYEPERVLAVNGLGELIVPPAGPIANDSPAELARLTGTRLLDAPTARARELAYVRANLVDAR